MGSAQLARFLQAESHEDTTAYAEHQSSSAGESATTTTAGTKPSSMPKHRRQTNKALLDRAVKLLQSAAAQNNEDALYLLGEMSFYGNYTYPRNYTAAADYYHRLSETAGNATAQHMLGFLYSTGMFGETQRDQARALMYHTFAAYGGNTRSEMTLGFRYHTGIGTPRNCEKAVQFYKRVADKAMDYWRTGPAGGRTLDRHTWRLADDKGGVYGEGASESSAGANARKRSFSASDSASFDDVLEYLHYMAEKSDIDKQYSLARLYYGGTRSLRRNYVEAMKYFKAVARHYWGKNGKPKPGATRSMQGYEGEAAGYLGRMYLRGEGLAMPDHAKALQWYKLGLEVGDAASQNGYGYMYLKGLGGLKQNTAKAAEYFRTAAENDFGPAQVNIGKLFLEQGEVSAAIHYFELAARHGHIEAFYYIAETYNQALGRERSCGMATIYYKFVAEKVEELQSPLAWAHARYEAGDFESALAGFMMAAEQGYESGQANVAFILDRDKSAISVSRVIGWLLDTMDTAERTEDDHKIDEIDRFIDEVALIYWTRASKQSNVDATVKMGDYYLKGIGTEKDYEKAAACYQAAAEYQQSALALWNLGWMRENGLGVEQDFHLAKRFYDLALTTNAEAYLPVTLSLCKLRLRSFWNSLTGGSVNGIGVDGEDAEGTSGGAGGSARRWSVRELWNRVFDMGGREEAEEEEVRGFGARGGNYQI
ncbi:uncharacterized protein V1518DRAFT_438051 [Limtongia smithiae]|uniref:uncharacterized protein n=1 Tax=Limtongia smithiae TaxID=1125753 RepID=UPI0034CFB6DF